MKRIHNPFRESWYKGQKFFFLYFRFNSNSNFEMNWRDLWSLKIFVRDFIQRSRLRILCTTFSLLSEPIMEVDWISSHEIFESFILSQQIDSESFNFVRKISCKQAYLCDSLNFNRNWSKMVHHLQICQISNREKLGKFFRRNLG